MIKEKLVGLVEKQEPDIQVNPCEEYHEVCLVLEL